MRPLPRVLSLLLAALLALGCLSGCQVSLERIANGGTVPEPPADYTGTQDGFRYTKTTLTGQERYLYDQILTALQAQEAEVTGLYPDTEMIQKVVTAIDRDYPELFWFSGTGEIETTLLAGKALEAAYRPAYTMDAAQREATQAQVDQWDSNSIVNIMVNGAGLCGCYAKTYQYLLLQLGIDVAYVTGQAGGESHAWNLAWLDGSPCWIDPTWGDPVFTGGDASQGPAYEYFGLTTDDLERTHTLDEAVPVPACTSQSNNYFLRSGLYFPSYDPASLVSVLQRAMAGGQTQAAVRYSDEAYAGACAALFDNGALAGLFQEAAQGAGVDLVPLQSLWYTRNDKMGVLTFLMP